MILGRVFGTVVSTVCHPYYSGCKLLLVDRVDEKLEPTGDYLVAVDSVQAGPGDVVLVIDEGNSARQVVDNATAPLRSIIVGIVDDVTLG